MGFISHALKYGDAIAAGKLLAPAKTLGEMRRIVFNDYIDASLAAVFVLVVVATVIYGLISIRKALGNPQPTAMEIGLAGAAREVAMPDLQALFDRVRQCDAGRRLLEHAHCASDDWCSRLRDIRCASAGEPSRPANHDVCGVLPRTPASPLRRWERSI